MGRCLIYSLITIFCAPISSIVAAESDQPKQEPEWFTCKNSTECDLVDEHCGRRSAVNKQFVSKYSAWLKATSDDSKCVTPKLKETETPIQSEEDLKVGCREGQCVVQEEGKPIDQ